MKLNNTKLIIIMTILVGVLFVGCSSEENLEQDNQDIVEDGSVDGETSPQDTSSQNEEVVEYFEGGEEDIDLGELI